MTLKKNEEGIFFGVAHDAYHADNEYEIPSFSGSLAKLMIMETPRAVWWKSPRLNPKCKPQFKKIWDRGSAAHALMLDAGAEIVKIDAKDWRGNDAKKQRDEARAAGAIPILVSDYDELMEMRDEAYEQLEALEGGNPFLSGAPEVVIRWKEEIVIHGHTHTVWCRAKLDWLNPESENLYDFKSMEGPANPVNWCKWRMWDQGAPYQAAFYRRGIRRLSQIGKLKMHDPDFLFLLNESKPPYSISLVNVPSSINLPHSLETADSKVEWAMLEWAKCLRDEYWPGYGSHVHVAESFKPKVIAVPVESQEPARGHLESSDAAAELTRPSVLVRPRHAG